MPCTSGSFPKTSLQFWEAINVPCSSCHIKLCHHSLTIHQRSIREGSWHQGHWSGTIPPQIQRRSINCRMHLCGKRSMFRIHLFGIEFCRRSLTIHQRSIREGSWHQGHWSGTIPPQIHHVKKSNKLPCASLQQVINVWYSSCWHWTLLLFFDYPPEIHQGMFLTPRTLIRNHSSIDLSCQEGRLTAINCDQLNHHIQKAKITSRLPQNSLTST